MQPANLAIIELEIQLRQARKLILVNKHQTYSDRPQHRLVTGKHRERPTMQEQTDKLKNYDWQLLLQVLLDY